MISKEEIDWVRSEYLKGRSERYSGSSASPEVQEFVESSIDLEIPTKEKVYCVIHGVLPECGHCGGLTKFKNFREGFLESCSVSCSVKLHKKSQEISRVENLERLTTGMSPEEIVKSIYSGSLKVQKWRDIPCLSRFSGFRSLGQLHRHLVLGETQICPYCSRVFDYEAGNPRKCNCTTKNDREFLRIKDIGDNLEFSRELVRANLHNPNAKFKRFSHEDVKSEFYHRFEGSLSTGSFQEDLYRIIHDITGPKNPDFINIKLGYRKETPKIHYTNDFLEVISQFREIYSEKGLSSSLEVQKFCSKYPGRSVIETIHLQESNGTIPECKDPVCNLPANFVKHKREYSSFCQACIDGKYQGSSLKEKEILEFVRSIYSGKIVEGDRKILGGKELDIYIPSKALAIEFNGLHWHSSRYIHKKYHLDKTEKCEAQGIQLIHVFEDEWDNKKEIVKSMISARLGVVEQKIPGRKCEVREVPASISNEFLEENHLQGKDNSPHRYGLYYHGDLVQVLTLKRSHRSRNKYLELKRSCSRLGILVHGGFSKLLKKARDCHPEEIVTFADRRYSGPCNVYEKSGFTLEGRTPPNYFYVLGGVRKSREGFQKHKLKGILENFDPEMTEKENMHSAGFWEIYDCGNYKYSI